jgi:hypothetical protein
MGENGRVVPAAAMVLAPLLALLGVVAYRLNTEEGREFLAREVIDSRLPSAPAAAETRLRPGVEHQTLAFLVISSRCVAARSPRLVPTLAATREKLSREARARGRTLRFVAVSVDDDLGAGLRFLARLGDFHEVSVGGNWLNTQVASLVWRAPGAEPAVPQWVVVERDVTIAQTRITVGPDRVVARIVGLEGMQRFTGQPRAGAPAGAPVARRPGAG